MNLGQSIVGSVQRAIATAQNGLEVLRLGGLETDLDAAPFEVMSSKPMYKLRRYFPDYRPTKPRSPLVLVPPMMLAADVYDVTREQGAVSLLHAAGIDPWVVDFGSPAIEEGGWDRTLADHIVAVSDAIDDIKRITGQDVHLAGYSQGGMFCYQTAAYRRSKDLASVITFGSPVELVAALPFGLPVGTAMRGANFLANHVFNHIAVTDWMARTGFQLLDPVKTVKARLDFVRQLHNREALLPREQQRRFLQQDGWVPWAGPAVAEVLDQFVVHNRMVSGGFLVNDQTVTLADITCPILAVVGEVDDIGQPVAVRAIKRAAPNAEIYEYLVRAGHFGLVVGSGAAQNTWPMVADFVHWRVEGRQMPADIRPLEELDESSVIAPITRIVHGLEAVSEAGLGIGRSVLGVTADTVKGTLGLGAEAARALPRLNRLGQIQSHTRISLGLLIDEQARRHPDGPCFLFEDRVHTNAAVNTRVNNVVKGLIQLGVRPAHRIGVLMDTRPSALVTIAALSRLGAVAVLLAPGRDLATAVELTDIDTVVTDPDNLRPAAKVTTNTRLLVLGGGGGPRGLAVAGDGRIVDMEQIDPDAVELPGWYQPNPGRARELAFRLIVSVDGRLEAKNITNYRWALSAFGTASSANLTSNDTVYCLAPLHHSSGLLVGVGGAVASGARIALARDLDPARFAEEVRRYGATVVTYTWTMLRNILDSNEFPPGAVHPIRLFIGSGMPVGLWRRTIDTFRTVRVLEFYASTEGDLVLANVSGSKPGCKGRPVPGTADVEIAAYDPVTRRYLFDDDGFVRKCGANEVGLLMSRAPRNDDLTKGSMRGVFAAGDAWIATENLFLRDSDGDYWLMDNIATVISSSRGPVYSQPIVDALNSVRPVDLEVVYGVGLPGSQVAVAAITVRQGMALSLDQLNIALATLVLQQRPDVISIVDSIPVSSSYRPVAAAVRATGLPQPGPQSWHLDTATGQYVPLTNESAGVLFSGVR